MSTMRDFDTWAAAVSRELVGLGLPMSDAKHIPYENEDWFRREYDDGQDAGMTAFEWFNHTTD